MRLGKEGSKGLNKHMKKGLVVLWLVMSSLLTAYGNSDERNWKLKSGKVLRAELVNVDEAIGQVELLVDDKHRVTKKIDQFSEVDIAWMYEWLNIQDELNVLNERVKGVVEHSVCKGKFETDLHCYYPSSYKKEEAYKAPLMLLFHAGAKSRRYLYRHMEAAEATGFVVISLGQFRNTGDDPEKEAAFLERFKEVFAHIQKSFMYDPKKVFMGGISGGAWKAYHYSAWVEYPWAGIYANGGWLGGEKYYEEDYAKGMKVVMVNGNNDHANRCIEPDTKILSKHQCEIAVISFEGGHNIPPPKTQKRAFEWLLKTEEAK